MSPSCNISAIACDGGHVSKAQWGRLGTSWQFILMHITEKYIMTDIADCLYQQSIEGYVSWWTLTSLLLDCQNAKRHLPLVRLNLGNNEIILTRKGKIFEYLVKKIASTFYCRKKAAIHKNGAKPQSPVWLLAGTGWAGNISFQKCLFFLSSWLGKLIPFSLMRNLLC